MEDEFGWLKYHGGFHNYGRGVWALQVCMMSQDGYYGFRLHGSMMWPNSTTKFLPRPICRKGVWNFGVMPTCASFGLWRTWYYGIWQNWRWKVSDFPHTALQMALSNGGDSQILMVILLSS